MLPAATASAGVTTITLLRRRVGRGQQHAVADLAAHLAGGEVGDDDDLLADQLLRLVVLAQARADLPALAVGQLDLEDQQLVGVGVGLAFEHRRDAKVELGKIVVVDRGVSRLWVGSMAVLISCRPPIVHGITGPITLRPAQVPRFLEPLSHSALMVAVWSGVCNQVPRQH